MDEDIDLGRLRVAIAFCDLAGYTRFTEEEGEEEALSFVERFVEARHRHAARRRARDQDDRRRGDDRRAGRAGARPTGPWASSSCSRERPEPRIGIHYGATLYRDGDYFGREVNLASRVVARARGGEVLVTDSVVERVAESEHLVLRGGRPGEAEGLRRAAPALPRDDAGELSPVDRPVTRRRARRADWSGRASRCWCCCPAAPIPSACSTWSLRLGARVSALHVNYGLRDDAERRRGASAGARVLVARGRRWRWSARGCPSSGNLQAARARRALPRSPSATPPGTTPPPTPPPTRPRRCSTASPSHPAAARCSAWRPARGRLVRPLLGVTREETRAYCRSRGLDWREDPSNEDPRFARARVRGELLPALRNLSPAAERTIAETARLLRDEAEVLDGAVADALEPARRRAGGGARRPGRAAARGRCAAGAALARRGRVRRPTLSLSRGRGRRRAARWAGSGGTASLDLGDGLRAVVEYGTLRFRPRPGTRPRPSRWSWACPGGVRFGGWEVEAARRRGTGEVQRRRGGRRGPARWCAPGGGRPDAAGGARRHQVAPGPVHRPQGPARAAPLPARGRGRRGDRVGRGRGARRALRGAGDEGRQRVGLIARSV